MVPKQHDYQDPLYKDTKTGPPIFGDSHLFGTPRARPPRRPRLARLAASGSWDLQVLHGLGSVASFLHGAPLKRFGVI